LFEGSRPVTDVKELFILNIWEQDFNSFNVIHSLAKVINHDTDVSNLVVLLAE